VLVRSIQSAPWPPAIRVPQGWQVAQTSPFDAYTSWLEGLAALTTTAAAFCSWAGGLAAGGVCDPHPATAETTSDDTRHTSALRVRST
jgi:hypothetical protein